MTSPTARRMKWNIICFVFALASYKSEAFATSFTPSSTRGGSSTVSLHVLKNPNGEYKNGAAVDIFDEEPTNNGFQKKNGVNGDSKNGQHVDTLMEAQFVAETNLPSDLGLFRVRAYRTAPSSNPFTGNEPCVIYSADKPPFGVSGELRENVPIRVHDQCLTSEVFGSNRYVLCRHISADFRSLQISDTDFRQSHF
jgi:hypothetical protein